MSPFALSPGYSCPVYCGHLSFVGIDLVSLGAAPASGQSIVQVSAQSFFQVSVRGQGWHHARSVDHYGQHFVGRGEWQRWVVHLARSDYRGEQQCCIWRDGRRMCGGQQQRLR